MKTSSILLCSAVVLTGYLTAIPATGQSALKKVMNSVTQAKTKPQQPVSPRDKWALIIGVGHYKDTSIQPLRFAEKNVNGLARLLVDPNIGRFAVDHVVTINDAQATEANLKTQLNESWLMKKALPNDMIVVYLYGRAQPAKDGSDINFVAYDTAAQSADSSGIAIKQVLAELKKRTQSKNIFCLIDVSPLLTNGQAATAVPAVPFTWQQLAQDDKITVLSSSDGIKGSLESPMAATSLFSHYVSEGLKAGGGLMSLEAVGQFVAQSVSTDAHNMLGKEQSPQFAVNPENADFAKLALGIPGQVPLVAKTMNIGHPLDTLALSRPDLAKPRKLAPVEETAPADDDNDDDDADSGNVDYGPYMTKMKKDIQAKWAPPKGLDERKVVATFSIMRDGKIVDPQIVESSGTDAIDESAINALKAASPLDPLPKGARKSVQIRYQFDWRVSRN